MKKLVHERLKDRRKKIDWKLWEKLSREALRSDDCLQACPCVERGWYNCDCEIKDFEKWDRDFLYHRKFQPKPVRAVNKSGFMIMKEKTGYIEGPYVYLEWLSYSWKLFDFIHDVLEGKRVPDWSDIFFRHEADFYSGIYSHFYQIFQIMICQLEGLEVRHSASNDVSRGANLFETILPKDFQNHKPMNGQGEMHTVPRIHKEFAEQIHKKSEFDFDVIKLQQQQLDQKLKNSKRVRLMRKNNRVRKNKTMWYRPPIEQNFDKWYFPLKQTPAWFCYKTRKWQYPPRIKTNPIIERSQKDLINKTIQKWLISGALFIMDNDEPDLITPSVFANVLLPGGPEPDPTKKPRMCHHGGYEKAIEGFSLPCRLEDLYNILQHISQGNLMTKSDDKSGFHLVLLNKESRKLVAFEYEGKILSYRGSVFGSPPVPGIFQRANMIAMNYLRTLGVRNSLYLDDRLALDTRETVYNGVPRNGWATAAMVVAAGGWISLEKSDFVPKMVQDFLGLRINTETCEISVPPEKWKIFRTMVWKILKDGQCTFLELQKLRGRCVSFILTNPMTKLFIREMNRIIAEANRKNRAKTDIILVTDALREELSEWVKLKFLKMRSKFLHEKDSDDMLPNKLAFTDASSFSASALVFVETDDIEVKQWFFDESTQQEPIYMKEAYAILWMLQDYGHMLSAKRIIHFCDNQIVVLTYNSLGSKVARLQAVIKLIYLELDKMGSKLILYWIDTENQLADAASRHIDYNQEYVPKILYRQFCRQIRVQPTIDVMATRANRKCVKWVNFGLDLHPDCIAYDFFSVDPKSLLADILWIFPPKNLIQQAMAHLARHYKNHRWLLVFHSFGEMPLGLPALLQLGGKLTKFHRFPATIVPAEKKLVFENQEFWGIWNDKVRATKILRMNC